MVDPCPNNLSDVPHESAGVGDCENVTMCPPVVIPDIVGKMENITDRGMHGGKRCSQPCHCAATNEVFVGPEMPISVPDLASDAGLARAYR